MIRIKGRWSDDTTPSLFTNRPYKRKQLCHPQGGLRLGREYGSVKIPDSPAAALGHRLRQETERELRATLEKWILPGNNGGQSIHGERGATK